MQVGGFIENATPYFNKGDGAVKAHFEERATAQVQDFTCCFIVDIFVCELLGWGFGQRVNFIGKFFCFVFQTIDGHDYIVYFLHGFTN